MKSVRCKMMMAVLCICMSAMVGCGNSADTPAGIENSTVESTVENTEEATEAITESTEETTAESTAENSSAEELSGIDARVASFVEELQITDEEKIAALEESMVSLYGKGVWWVDQWAERMKLDWDWLKDKEADDISMHAGVIANAILNNSLYQRVAEYAVERANNAEGIKWDINNLPEDRAWIDDLAEKLAAKDFDAVHEILCDDSIVEKAAPYRDPLADGDSKGEAYRLVTTDGRYVGLRLNEESESFTRTAFYSEVEEDREFGFKYLAAGDVWVLITKSQETGEIKRAWSDGDMYHKPDGEATKLEQDAYVKWFYLINIGI